MSNIQLKEINTKLPLRTIKYQWESLLYRKNIERKPFTNSFGTIVLTRNNEGFAQKIKFQIYANNNQPLYIVGPWNKWGKCSTEELETYKCQPHETGFQTITLTNIKHKDEYLFMNEDGTFLRDPASTYFNDNGNCVFWDFKDPTTYQKKYAPPDTLHRATKILQTDLPGLVSRWYTYDKKGKQLANIQTDIYTYIRTCGVLEKIKELGFNTIQFLPLAQSIDGNNWKFRYLVTYPFAIQKNWGTPDSFKQLVDHCHKLNIAIINDVVVSHCPHKDYSLFNQHGEDVGLHKWQNKHNEDTYLDEYTPWGTKRFRYGDEHVRRFLTESALFFQDEYGIDGFRIDNVDGILRFGDSGQGDERPHGRLFLRECISTIYEYNPRALIHLESHYFFGDNAKMLVAPLTSNPRALGATAYNSSRITYYFHKEFMPKAVEDTTVWRFEHIREEKEWGDSNSTIADFHNHDAAAGLMAERATGSYAYDALILKRPELKYHAIGKIKIMEAIIACGCEGRILDLLQTFLLQLGTFEHDTSIHWDLLEQEESFQVVKFKQRINELLEHPAFWPENTLYRQYINVDETNKILIIKRSDITQNTNEEFYILINLSSKHINDYAIGVPKKGTYTTYLNSDNDNDNKTYTSKKSNRFEHFSQEILVSDIKPYHIFILRHKRKEI